MLLPTTFASIHQNVSSLCTEVSEASHNQVLCRCKDIDETIINLGMWRSFLTVVTHTGGHGTSARSTPSLYAEEGWEEGASKTTIRAENEVEAHREANNYRV